VIYYNVDASLQGGQEMHGVGSYCHGRDATISAPTSHHPFLEDRTWFHACVSTIVRALVARVAVGRGTRLFTLTSR